MSCSYRLIVALGLSLPTMVSALAGDPPLKPIVVPSSGGWMDLVSKTSPTSDAETIKRVGRLKIEDSRGDTHYCTAQLVVPFKTGDMSSHANDPLLLTAAHCARSDFTIVSFVPQDLPTTITVNCKARNSHWVDPNDTSKPQPDPFINARFDYAFLKIASDMHPTFKIKWGDSWMDNTLKNKPGVTAVGYPDAIGTGETPLSALALGNLELRSDFYHQKLNAISTPDVTFTNGTSGGAWLQLQEGMGAVPYVVSLTSSYIGKTSNTGVQDYITIYGPILHDDAHKLALFAAESETDTGGDCE
jgi:hypothetical protein